jgi:pimeloyl-ACP methyl ester carboxylesterase
VKRFFIASSEDQAMTPAVYLSGQLCTGLLWQHQHADCLLELRDHDTVRELAVDTLVNAPKRFALVAHGMAGFIAFEIMRQAPERVEKLVLMSTLAAADTPKQTVRREGYLRLVEEGRFADIIEERIPMLIDPDRRDDGVLTGTLRQMARDIGEKGFLNQQRAIMSRPDSRPGLGAIACPVLLVFGRADGITTLEHQNEMLGAIPNARLEIIEDSGHMIPLERPERTNAILRAFLGS